MVITSVPALRLGTAQTHSVCALEILNLSRQTERRKEEKKTAALPLSFLTNRTATEPVK